MTSKYLDKPHRTPEEVQEARRQRGECMDCRAPASKETGLCEGCYLNAQADVDDTIIDADELQAHRMYAGEKR